MPYRMVFDRASRTGADLDGISRRGQRTALAHVNSDATRAALCANASSLTSSAYAVDERHQSLKLDPEAMRNGSDAHAPANGTDRHVGTLPRRARP